MADRTPIEAEVLDDIATLIRAHEPQFDLSSAFHKGPRGRADPDYWLARKARLRESFERGAISAATKAICEIEIGLEIEMESDPKYRNRFGWEVGPLVNWRVTAQRGDKLIHVMASDQSFAHFAVAVQDRQKFEQALEKNIDLRILQKTTNRTGLKTLIDETWSSMLEQEKAIREEANTKWKIEFAVAKEREIWQERLSKAESNLAIAKLVGVVAVILTFLYSNGQARRITQNLFDYFITLLGGVVVIAGIAFLMLGALCGLALKLFPKQIERFDERRKSKIAARKKAKLDDIDRH